MTLLDALLREAPPGVRRLLANRPGVEAQLEALYAEARSAWPDVSLEAGAFFTRLGAHLDEAGAVALETRHTADVYLATACLEGDGRALAHFEGVLRAACASAARRVGAVEVDALASTVRARALVEPRGLERYGGRGSLRAWLAAVSTRAALDERRAEGRVARREAAVEADAAGATDAELALLKAKYRGDFEAAFVEALDGLGARERALLRLHGVEGLGLDRLARLLGVGRSTAARRLQALRTSLYEATRRGLAARLGVAEGAVESLLPLLHSQVDVSLRRRLGGDEP